VAGELLAMRPIWVLVHVHCLACCRSESSSVVLESMWAVVQQLVGQPSPEDNQWCHTTCRWCTLVV